MSSPGSLSVWVLMLSNGSLRFPIYLTLAEISVAHRIALGRRRLRAHPQRRLAAHAGTDIFGWRGGNLRLGHFLALVIDEHRLADGENRVHRRLIRVDF